MLQFSLVFMLQERGPRQKTRLMTDIITFGVGNSTILNQDGKMKILSHVACFYSKCLAKIVFWRAAPWLVSKGVFKQKTWTKGVACERAHLCELGKNFVGSARRLTSKSNFCRGRFPFVTVTLTVRSPRTRKGEKIRSCITVTVTPRSLPFLPLVL